MSDELTAQVGAVLDLREGGPLISAAFVKAQAKLQNPRKDQEATIRSDTGRSYSYTYVDLATVIDGVRDVLAQFDLGFTQNVVTGEGRINVTTVLRHESGETLTFGPLVGPGGNDWRQLGGAISYAKRYALLAALGIAPSDEDDDAANAPTELDELTPEACAAYVARFRDAANLGELNKARHELRRYRVTDEQTTQLDAAYAEREQRATPREPAPARSRKRTEEPVTNIAPVGIEIVTPLFDELDKITDRAALKAFHDRPEVAELLDRPYDDSGDTMRVRVMSKLAELSKADVL